MSLYTIGLEGPAPTVRTPMPLGAIETFARAPKPWPLYILIALALIYSGRSKLSLLPGV